MAHPPGVSAIEAVTIGVSDLDAALRLFRDAMGFRIDARFAAGADVRTAWRLPPSTACEIVELSARGYRCGRLRLAAYGPTPGTRVRVHSGPAPHDGAADIGPKAIDFYVRAPMQRHYEAVLAAGYVARSPPIVHDVGDMTSEEFVFWGPDGVPILLMVGHRHGPEHLRPGWREGDFSEVATVSVVADDPDASRRFYRELLGLSSLVDTESAPEFREQACRLVGVPPDTRIFWQLYSAPGEPSGKILVLHFVGAGAKRLRGRMRPGHLGFSLLTHRCSDLDGLAARLAAAGVRTWGAPARVEWNGADRRILMVEGPNEELFEFVETRT